MPSIKYSIFQFQLTVTIFSAHIALHTGVSGVDFTIGKTKAAHNPLIIPIVKVVAELSLFAGQCATDYIIHLKLIERCRQGTFSMSKTSGLFLSYTDTRVY